MTKTLLIGKAKELFVATVLVGRHLHVYLPLVDNGFDLVVTSPDGSRHLPVQVKYRAKITGFNLDREDATRFAEAGAVLAFGSKEANEQEFFFFPAKEWLQVAQQYDRNRRDNKLVVYLSKSAEWAEGYRGQAGIDRCFAGLIRVA
ncbi:hypothetical protein [Variovorax sp. 350MFTsu5.1]|uniref:hypothetical protein n=1 Tax=Variovorax sp. 350MFTsu5.1 TaxID=3158365 RepID=UPI003AB04AEF